MSEKIAFWTAAKDEFMKRFEERRLKNAAKELEAFLLGEEGVVARKLLYASGRKIMFAKKGIDHAAYETVAVLTGFKDLTFWNLNFEGKDFGTTDVQRAIECAVRYLYLAPEQVLPWLIEQINAIAREILSGTGSKE